MREKLWIGYCQLIQQYDLLLLLLLLLLLFLLLLLSLMTLIIGFACPPTILFKFITKCDSFFYYKVRQVLFQSATGITKCASTRTSFLDFAVAVAVAVAVVVAKTGSIVLTPYFSHLSTIDPKVAVMLAR